MSWTRMAMSCGQTVSKALGGLVLVLAIGVAMPAAASGSEGQLVWGSGTTWITGEQDPSEASQVFTVRNSLPEPLSFTCNEVSGKAMIEGSQATNATLESVTYSDSGPKGEGLNDTCTGPGETKPLVKMNGCNYRLHVGTIVGVEESEGTLDVVCPEGKEIEITGSLCLVTIPAQENLGPVFFRTISPGGSVHVTIEIRIGHNGASKKAFAYSTSGLLCGSHKNETDGTYTGKVTAKGSNAGGVQTSLAIRKEGIFSWDSGTTKLVGEADPSSPSQVLTVTPGGVTGSFTCDEVTGSAAVEGTGGEAITATGIGYDDSGTTTEPGKCTGNVAGISLKTTVNFNGCDYDLRAGTTLAEAPNGETEGTLEVKCTEGKAIEFSAAGCLVKIGLQTAGPIYYRTTHTEGHKEEVTVEERIGDDPTVPHNDALNYTTSGLTCGTHSETDGTFTGKLTFHGANAKGEATNVAVT